MFEFFTLAGALAFGSLAFYGFWVSLIVFTLFLIGFAEKELYGWATVIFIGAFVALAFSRIFNLYKFALQHPGVLIEYFVGYVVLGMIWGAFKWWRFCVKRRNEYEEAKVDFLKSKSATEMTPELRVGWTDKLRNRSSYSRYHGGSLPLASDNKEKIMNWMYLWPFSMLGYVFSDFVIRFGNFIYERMGGIYRSIAESVWKGTEADLASESDQALVAAKIVSPPTPEFRRSY